MNNNDEIRHDLGDREGEAASMAARIVTVRPRRRRGRGGGGQHLLMTAYPIATPRLTQTAAVGQGA
jgi:hypothetical protein